MIEEWIDIVEKLPDGSKVLVEDGGSIDGTIKILENLQATHKNLDVVYRDKADGFGNAAKRLLISPETKWVFFTDSDGQYVTEDFWILWNRRDSFDVIRGIKMGRQDPLMRRIISFVWNKMVAFLFNFPLIDINAAFVLIRKPVIAEVLPQVTRLKTLVTYEFIIRAILANFEVKNTYIQHRKRKSGKSRGVPAIKLPAIAYFQLLRLFKIKSDYRIE